ncbi:BTAD domain-containing putative transcriptional regulator [Pseudooceanicola sp. MF1-13]|uniref:AfsR/SARP family transcriptional regulator n=1 Tax=Pseudooceanicola sp. MF1-13 TaxID=3379095 RepID=UPI0038912BC7
MTLSPTLTDPQPPARRNLALFADLRDQAFVSGAIDQLCTKGAAVVISDNDDLIANLPPARVLRYAEVGAHETPIRFDRLQARISDTVRGASLVVVDMAWWLASVHSAASPEGWARVCDDLTKSDDMTVLSVYDANLLIADQFLAAMRGHEHLLAPSGIYPNPLWIPPRLSQSGTLTEQMTHLLGQIVPDYATSGLPLVQDRDAASGSDPKWAGSAKWAQPRLTGPDGWKICCLGRLRVFMSNGDQLRWDIPGGAPKKSKALFAFLLQRGERGARATQLAELLWPEEPDEDIKRKRLHHAIAMLRRTLGSKDHIRRMGDYYALVPPANSWVDITSFEQLCNRAHLMTHDHQDDRAIALLEAADRLYEGDLFEDIGDEFVETEVDDWVLPRRVWLREMAIKVQLFKANIRHRTGHLREALDSCQTALSMDPLSEAAHAQMMQIFHDQGRPQAVARQYRQYQTSLAQIDASDEASELSALYHRLMASA